LAYGAGCSIRAAYVILDPVAQLHRNGASVPRKAPQSATAEIPTCRPPGADELPTARFRRLLLMILAVGAVCRAIILVDYLAHNPTAATPITDAAWYWSWAQRIAAGELIGRMPFTSAPLYPYLLGLLRALGGGLKLLYVAQTAVSLLTAFLLAQIARRRFGETVGLVAAALFLLLQEPASAALRVLTSTLELLMVVIVWGLLVRLQARPSSWAAHVAAGAGLGLLCLAFAPALLLLPAAVCWLALRTPRLPAIARAAAFAAAAAVVIAPATLHNWLGANEFFLIRTGAGLTLRQGNHPQSVGAYTPIPGVSVQREKQYESAAEVYRQETGQQPTWTAVDRYFRQQAVSFWRSNPGRALELAAAKLYATLTYQNYSDIYQTRAEIACGLTRALWLAPLPMPLLIAAALVGALYWLRRPLLYAPEWMLVILPILVTVVFFYSPRYRLPAAPVLTVAAALALVRAWHWRRHRATAAAVIGALAASLTLTAVNAACGRDALDYAGVYRALAEAYAQEGRMDDSTAMLRQAVQADPGDVDSRICMADRLRSLDRLDEAAGEYLQAFQLAPDDAALFSRTFSALARAQRVTEAEALAARVMQHHPADPVWFAALAEAKLGAGDLRGANECITQALALAPENTRWRLLQVDVLIGLQRFAEAERELERILKSAPDDCGALWRQGQVAGRAGRPAEARRLLEHALAVCPDNAPAWHDLAVVNMQVNRPQAARDCLRKALQLNPRQEISRQLLTELDSLGTPPVTQP